VHGAQLQSRGVLGTWPMAVARGRSWASCMHACVRPSIFAKVRCLQPCSPSCAWPCSSVGSVREQGLRVCKPCWGFGAAQRFTSQCRTKTAGGPGAPLFQLVTSFPEVAPLVRIHARALLADTGANPLLCLCTPNIQCPGRCRRLFTVPCIDSSTVDS